MLKKEITYSDLDGNPLTETFWFHMTEADLARIALGKEGKEGGFEAWVRRIKDSNDGEVIIENFEKILLATIGRRSEDNKSFIKNESIRENFQGSDAYSKLFMEMVTDAQKMAEFINGVVPAAMREQVAKASQEQLGVMVTQPQGDAPLPKAVEMQKDERPDWLKEPNRVPTMDELKGATPDQMMEAFRRREAAGSGS